MIPIKGTKGIKKQTDESTFPFTVIIHGDDDNTYLFKWDQPNISKDDLKSKWDSIFLKGENTPPPDEDEDDPGDSDEGD